MNINIRNFYYYILSGQRYSFFHWLHQLTLPLTHRISLNSGKDLAAAWRSMTKPSTRVCEGTRSQVSPSPRACLGTLGTLFPPYAGSSRVCFLTPVNPVSLIHLQTHPCLFVCIRHTRRTQCELLLVFFSHHGWRLWSKSSCHEVAYELESILKHPRTLTE